MKVLAPEFKIGTGTMLFVADKPETVNQALGAVRVKLNELFELADDSLNFT